LVEWWQGGSDSIRKNIHRFKSVKRLLANLFFLISSTVSSGINAVGALILEDFILKKWPKTKPSLQITISKLIGEQHWLMLIH